MDEGTIETPCGPLRVVRSTRAAGAVDVGDVVAIVASDQVRAEPRLLALPTVRRLARAGLRSIVLVPVAEILAVFPSARRPAPRPAM